MLKKAIAQAYPITSEYIPNCVRLTIGAAHRRLITEGSRIPVARYLIIEANFNLKGFKGKTAISNVVVVNYFIS